MSNEATAKNSYEHVAYLDEANAKRFVEFLEYSGIRNHSNDFDEVSSLYAVSVPSVDFEKAQNLFMIFSENEFSSEDEEPVDFINDSGNIYTNATEKYNDNMSSALTFLICGVIGFIINAVRFILSLKKNGTSLLLMHIVLCIVFVAFIYVGIKSLRYSKQLKAKFEAEKGIKAKMRAWLKDNVSKEDIESSYDTSIPEEMKYFNRSTYIKKRLNEQFPNIDSELLDAFTDDYIEKNF